MVEVATFIPYSTATLLRRSTQLLRGKQSRRRQRKAGEDGAPERLGKGGAGDLLIRGTLRGGVSFHHALLGEDEPHLGDSSLGVEGEFHAVEVFAADADLDDERGGGGVGAEESAAVAAHNEEIGLRFRIRHGERFFLTQQPAGRQMEGKKIAEWGKHGTGPGEFDVVHSIAIGPNGNLYVADRENGRLQWFSQSGKFLGEWKYGGQLYTVAFSHTGEFYAATHPKGVPLDNEFNVVKIDLANGRIIGKFEVRSHELAVAPDGTLLPATRGSQLVLLKPLR